MSKGGDESVLDFEETHTGVFTPNRLLVFETDGQAPWNHGGLPAGCLSLTIRERDDEHGDSMNIELTFEQEAELRELLMRRHNERSAFGKGVRR